MKRPTAGRYPAVVERERTGPAIGSLGHSPPRSTELSGPRTEVWPQLGPSVRTEEEAAASQVTEAVCPAAQAEVRSLAAGSPGV